MEARLGRYPSAEIRITATDEYGRQLFTVTTKTEN